MNTDETIQRLASAYAKATTTSRCYRMGECEGCTIKHCDYRSRLEAYIQGYKQNQVNNCMTADCQQRKPPHVSSIRRRQIDSAGIIYDEEGNIVQISENIDILNDIG